MGESQSWKRAIRRRRSGTSQPGYRPPGRPRRRAGPSVVLFGCSDSRVAAEMIFDQGLGDMFVVRTAGPSSIHRCWDPRIRHRAPRRAADRHPRPRLVRGGRCDGGIARRPGHPRRLRPRHRRARRAQHPVGPCEGEDPHRRFEAEHVVETGDSSAQRSLLIKQRVDRGQVAIVGLTYHLADGRVSLRSALGDVDDAPSEPVEP